MPFILYSTVYGTVCVVGLLPHNICTNSVYHCVCVLTLARYLYLLYL